MIAISTFSLLAGLSASPAPVVAVFELQDMRPERTRLEESKRAALTDYLRNLLAEGGSMKIVPSAGIRRAMLGAKKGSYDQCFDEACQIEIGKAVSAQKVVTTKIIEVGRHCIITSTLFDLRTETTDRAEHEKGKCDEESISVKLEKVAVKLRASKSMADLERHEDKPPEPWDPKGRGRVIVSFGSEPPGAVVLIDGELACQDSSKGCERALRPGRHRISMRKERYVSRDEEITVQDGSRVVWELEPSFGSLKVSTQPSGLRVRIDGRDVGQTPLTKEVDPGEHVITLADPCFYESRQAVTVLKARSERVKLEAAPRFGAIDVNAVDQANNAVRADVFIDGKHAGETPVLVKVSVCAKKLRVHSGDHGTYEQKLNVSEKQTEEILASLDANWKGGGEGADATAEKEKEKRPPVRAFRVGAQLMLGILCLESQKVGTETKCVNTNTGYGGMFQAQFPVDPGGSGFFVRGAARAGFLYYPNIGLGSTAIEIPAGFAAEFGLIGGGEYGIAAETLYVFRKITGGLPADPTNEEIARFNALEAQSNHAFDLGFYLFARFVQIDFGGGIYIPLTGLGETIVARVWMGYSFTL